MLIEIVGWDAEDRQPRLFELPAPTAEALQVFVATGQADDALAEKLDTVRQGYLAIAQTPMAELDRHYRERLVAMYVWNELAGNEITADFSWEFSLR